MPASEKNLPPPLTRGAKKRPGAPTVPVRLEVPVRIYRGVRRLTSAYTRLSLGQVLERWVEDAAYGASRPESWEYRQAVRWLRGHPFPKETRPRPKHRARRAPEVA